MPKALSFGYTWGKGSLANYVTLHPKLQQIFDLALTRADLTIVNGWRGEVAQNAAVKAHLSQTPWPKSKHNSMKNGKPCSRAADFGLFPDWTGTKRADYPFLFAAGLIYSCACELGIKVRMGWDFNRNMKADDNFEDIDHVELDDSEV